MTKMLSCLLAARSLNLEANAGGYNEGSSIFGGGLIMAVSTLETLEGRVAAIEAEIARMKEMKNPVAEKPWWEQIRGESKDDPIYKEAMRLGREYRESLRPADDEENNF